MSNEVIIITWNEITKNGDNYTEISKTSSKWSKKRGAVKVYRGAFSKFNTRGEIAEEIHGDAGATVTRKDMENRFGTRVANKFTEKDKNSSDWSEVEKE